MVEKFDADFNKEIRKTINLFNQKIKRAEKRGEGRLPSLRSVREFKEQFTTKQDAKKELASLRTLLDNKEALARHRTKEGTITNWEFDYIVKNLEETDKWLTRELVKAKERYKDYPEHLYAIRADVNRLMDEKAIINRNLSDLTARELKTVSATIDRYKKRSIKMPNGRKHYMRNLDLLLTAKGIDVKERQNIYRKLNSLTLEEFEELYARHDVVGDIMLAIPSVDDSIEESPSKMAENAMADMIVQDSLDLFLDQLDTYIDEAKKAVSDSKLIEVASDEELEQYLKELKR